MCVFVVAHHRLSNGQETTAVYSVMNVGCGQVTASSLSLKYA